MFTPKLLIKLSLIGLIWSQYNTSTNFLMKFIPNRFISEWIALTILLILIHIVDVYYDRMKKNKKE